MSNRALAPVDTSTGEIITDGSAYIRHRSQDVGYGYAIEKERYIYSTTDVHWVASYHDPIERISRELTLTQTGAIIKLLPYMRFKADGKLVKDGNPLNRADIQRIFKRGKTATGEIMTALEGAKVIHKRKEGRANVYYMSDEFHEKGNVKDGVSFTKLYQVRSREITDELNLHEAGVLYKVIPYFHYELFYLCANPNEKDFDKLRFINRQELSDIIGLNVDDITRLVRKLKRLKALMSTESGVTVRYLIHPDLMYRMARETEWARSVRRMFDTH